MGKNIIVSEDTVRDLLEAHASLSAWYYELWGALRAANATARTPDDAARAAFVERLGAQFPEVAAVARSIRVPRLYVPAPPSVPGGGPAAGPEPAGAPPHAAVSPTSEAAAPAPGLPPMVVPGTVKYE
jgi:hypothetical protein